MFAESLGGAAATAKPKRRAYLLKRKALTTGFFDSKTKDDKDKGECGLFILFVAPKLLLYIYIWIITVRRKSKKYF